MTMNVFGEPIIFIIICDKISISKRRDNHAKLHFNIFRGFNTEVALRKAKENVEKHYAVVGVLEDLNKTLTVLEHYIPRFFKGAKDVYYSKFEEIEFHQYLKHDLIHFIFIRPNPEIL